MSPAPLFVLGVARSGTNLLARMLGRHGTVSMALDPLLPFFKSLRNAIIAAQAPPAATARFDAAAAFQDYYFDPDGVLLLDTILGGSLDLEVPRGEHDLLPTRVRERAALESVALGDRLARLGGRTYRELLSNALAIVAGSQRPSWVGIKEVWIIEFVPLLARAFPEARFYAIERDPRAIIASLLAMARRDPTQAAHVPSYLRHWRKNVALSRRFAADPDLAARFRVVNYERLASAPEPEARRLCAELHLDFDAAMLSLSDDGWAGNSSFGARRHIYSDTAYRWRTALDPAAIAAAEYLCGPEMMLTEYEPTVPAALRADVLAYLEHASSEPGSWRSDSGDPLIDIGGELLRQSIVAGSLTPGESLVRRCFLFAETLHEIRHGGAPAVVTAGRQCQ